MATKLRLDISEAAARQIQAKPAPKAVFSADLKCYWTQWTVLGDVALRLDIPKDNSTDMSGTIRAAKQLMPEVVYVWVVCDGTPDIRYSQHFGGVWAARTNDEVEAPHANG